MFSVFREADIVILDKLGAKTIFTLLYQTTKELTLHKNYLNAHNLFFRMLEMALGQKFNQRCFDLT